MHHSRAQARAPGSFTPVAATGISNMTSTATSNATTPNAAVTTSSSSPLRQQHQHHARPPPPSSLRKVDSSDSEDSTVAFPTHNAPISTAAMPGRQRTNHHPQDGAPSTPIAAQFGFHPNSSSASLQSQNQQGTPSQHQNFSRPSGTRAASQTTTSSPLRSGHARKSSGGQGLFDSSLPSQSSATTTQQPHQQTGMGRGHDASSTAGTLSASQIAAQAAVMSHAYSQQQQQQQLQQQHLQQQLLQQSQQYQQNHHQQQQQQYLQHQQQQAHTRQRSQTVPFPGDGADGPRRGSGSKGPVSPPTFNLIEASAPRDSALGSHAHQQYLHTRDERLGSTPSSAAATAANVVFPRSGRNSPIVPPLPSSVSPQPLMPPPPIPASIPEKQSKSEKAKARLFSRPGKISTRGESKDKPLPSPGKIGNALSALQRGNFSTSSLVDQSSASSLYSMNNSSSATIRPIDTLGEEKGKDKEKKHHFLSRQRQKLKEDFHLPLSSAASNSRPTDPNAPNSLYNFNIPASPGPSSTSFVKAKKEKKHMERSESRLDGDSLKSDFLSSVPSLSQQSTLLEPLDVGKLGLQSMSLDDAWPLLKAKLLVIFEGEEIITPIEDWNRVVQMHIQYCVQRRSPNMMLEDLRELLETGFSSLDRTLRLTPEDRFIPVLVELWVFTFTSILPFLQTIFLPLDLEVSGCGSILSPEQAHDFWGGLLASTPGKGSSVAPLSSLLDVRCLVLTAYRDVVILPRYETLKTIFSRLSLEFLPSGLGSNTSNFGSPPVDMASYSTSPPDSFFPPNMARPGTAMSLDPSNASYNSSSTTLLNDSGSASASAGGRSRAISNVSFGSHGSDGYPPGVRPFTPSALGSVREREQNVEDSKYVTDLVGRMLQCMSVLSSLGGPGAMRDAADGSPLGKVGSVGASSSSSSATTGPNKARSGSTSGNGNEKMEELCKMLKLNWLGRGRTGRNRRGIVGPRVRREETTVS